MKLKEIREENNKTQKDIANILKVARSSYGMWEQEQDFIPLNRLNDFSNYFNVSIDYILGLNNHKTYSNSKKEIDYNLLKKRLKDLRKNNHLTQEALSKNLNMTRSLISKYENGTNIILTSFLISYCQYFNVSADYLLGKIN